jgi:hypothetical protein
MYYDCRWLVRKVSLASMSLMLSVCVCVNRSGHNTMRLLLVLLSFQLAIVNSAPALPKLLVLTSKNGDFRLNPLMTLSATKKQFLARSCSANTPRGEYGYYMCDKSTGDLLMSIHCGRLS